VGVLGSGSVGGKSRGWSVGGRSVDAPRQTGASGHRGFEARTPERDHRDAAERGSAVGDRHAVVMVSEGSPESVLARMLARSPKLSDRRGFWLNGSWAEGWGPSAKGQ
jgi:hypothetical protein